MESTDPYKNKERLDYSKLCEELKLKDGESHNNMKKVFKKFGYVDNENYDLESIAHYTGDTNCVCSKDIFNVFTVYSKKHDIVLVLGSRCIERFSECKVKKYINKARTKFNKKNRPSEYCCICDSDRKISSNVLAKQEGLKKRYHAKCNPFKYKICQVDNCSNYIPGREKWKTKCLSCHYGRRYYRQYN